MGDLKEGLQEENKKQRQVKKSAFFLVNFWVVPIQRSGNIAMIKKHRERVAPKYKCISKERMWEIQNLKSNMGNLYLKF